MLNSLPDDKENQLVNTERYAKDKERQGDHVQYFDYILLQLAGEYLAGWKNFFV